MDIEKHLILVKGEDKTESICYCKYEKGKYQVTFTSGKTYTYLYSDVMWLKNPALHNNETTVVYHANQSLSGVTKILDFGEYIRICFVTGYKKVYGRKEITLEQSCLNNRDAHKSFEYLKQLAERVSVANEEERSFLYKQFEKITFISPSSVLA